jgi:acylphosphatase
MTTVARHVRVTGRVQGVFFRAWTRDEANRGGVAGWVRNDRDGSVEAHLEGELPAIRWVIDKMAYGPSGARVDNVEVHDAEPEGLSGFDVRH